jgi:hypothetical protein
MEKEFEAVDLHIAKLRRNEGFHDEHDYTFYIGRVISETKKKFEDTAVKYQEEIRTVRQFFNTKIELFDFQSLELHRRSVYKICREVMDETANLADNFVCIELPQGRWGPAMNLKWHAYWLQKVIPATGIDVERTINPFYFQVIDGKTYINVIATLLFRKDWRETLSLYIACINV